MPKSDELPPVVCAVDERYRGALCVLMESLAAAHGPALAELRLIVLHHELGADSRDRILRQADDMGLSLELRAVSPPRERFPVSGWVSDAAYLRLFIGEAVHDHPAALYLDADVLVLDDIRGLLRTTMDGALLAAVRDPEHPMIGLGFSLPGWRELGLPADRDYFNSGVLLFDLDRCRAVDLFDRCRRFLVERPQHVRFWDQDALNWAVDDQWRRLDRRWNTFPISALTRMADFNYHAEHVRPLRQLIADEDTAGIMHYAGPEKPWRQGFPAGRALQAYRRFMDLAAERESRAPA